MDVVYGIEVLPTNDPYVEAAEKGIASVSEAAKPGTFLVDFLPLRKYDLPFVGTFKDDMYVVKYIPSWMPGAGFQHKARESKTLADFVREAPFAALKDALVSRTVLSSGSNIDRLFAIVGERDSETIVWLLRSSEY